jgi:DNA-binding MarR family transcriptional regulator
MTETRWLDEREQATWRAFLDGTRLLFAQLDRELQHEVGIPLAYYDILARLSEAPAWTLRMSELAEQSQYSRSRISHAVARLEERGWVRRDRCPTDRRGQFAVLTDAGFAVLAAAAPGHVDSVRRHLLDPLTRAQVDELGRISAAVRDHLLAVAQRDGARPVDAGL